MQKERTPPPKNIPVPDTVPGPGQASLAGYRSDDPSLSRSAVLRDVGEIPSVTLEYFKSAALPPLPQQINVMKVRESLQRDDPVWSGDSWRWAGFDTDGSDSESDKSEDMTLRPLTDVFDAVVCEGSKTASTPAKLRFASRPTELPTSERSSSTRPDAYLLLVDKKSVDVAGGNQARASKDSSPDSRDDMAVSFEFKEGGGGTDRQADDRVIWCLNHIMRGDPCRRATFGVTIENTQTRFWFTCRAITLEPEHLIYFFCSLVFADDHELGWDPSIQRVHVGGKIQYDITVPIDEGKDLVYQTTRIISDFSADALSGCGTRVFEAHLKSPNGGSVKDVVPVVLKDTWRDCDRDREDIILQQIFADLRKDKGPEQEEEARKYFLTVLAAGNVIVDGKIDGTDTLLRGSELPPNFPSCSLPADDSPKPKPTRTDEGLSPTFPCVSCSTKCSKVRHRTHSRLVFKEVCHPIYELHSLDAVFGTLEDVRKALQILHTVGWVHRDVSAGNVLCSGKIGKLADLEYAKRMGSNTGHEVRVGTLDFMACEVEAQEYLFLQPNTINENFMLEEQIPFPFRFNPLHDVESIWWILVWILYYHVDQQGGQPSSGQVARFHKLFPRRLNSRTSGFLASLKVDVLPISFRLPARIANNMRHRLRMAYIASETNMPPAYADSLEQLHSVFAQCFRSAAEHSKGVSLFRPSTKRDLEDATPGDRGPKKSKRE
ncbi:hypothetical protein EDD16DRAFT_1226423 [Pisolithus croceorrhizus]|nr:hypothetical protein EV401DRAFT_2278586 [Pisolithus croceorrhizus]KAI6110914.1 hypothetical protein EDD16DRAFT_1226423 [Pisolithus croceorrhizus]